jgi:hypothetical protein
MPVILSTSEAEHAVVLTITDPWSVPELSNFYPEIEKIMDKAPVKIHTIVDMAHARRPPPGVLSARLDTPVVHHPNSGLLVIIGASAFVRSLSDVVMRLMRFHRVQFVDGREDARIFLNGVNSSTGSETAVE